MFEQRDFFEEQADAQSGLTIGGRQIAAGQIGAWLLHLAKLLVLLYTGYHGIHASVAYGGGGLGTFFQAAGIVVVELTLLGLYLAFVGAYINDGIQRWIAFAVYGIGLLTVILTSVADSIATAGYDIPAALLLYLQFGLPVSPVVMLLGGFLVHYFEPTAVRGRAESSKREELAEVKFQAWMASQSADLTAKKTVANAMLNAKTSAAQQIAAQFQSPDVQAAIKATALANLPALLTSIGINPETLDLNKDGRITADEVAAAGLTAGDDKTYALQAMEPNGRWRDLSTGHGGDDLWLVYEEMKQTSQRPLRFVSRHAGEEEEMGVFHPTPAPYVNGASIN